MNIAFGEKISLIPAAWEILKKYMERELESDISGLEKSFLYWGEYSMHSNLMSNIGIGAELQGSGFLGEHLQFFADLCYPFWGMNYEIWNKKPIEEFLVLNPTPPKLYFENYIDSLVGCAYKKQPFKMISWPINNNHILIDNPVASIKPSGGNCLICRAHNVWQDGPFICFVCRSDTRNHLKIEELEAK